LEDPLSVPGVDVADVAELLHGRRLHTGLLGDLPQSRQLGPLSGPDQALRESPGALRLPSGTDRGDDRPPTQLPDDDPTGGEAPARARSRRGPRPPQGGDRRTRPDGRWRG